MNGNPPPPLQPPVSPAKTSALAIWSLVLGILSVCCFSICTAIPAVICGHMALGRIKRSLGGLTGGGLAVGGLVTGYVSIAISIFLIPLMLGIAAPAFVKAKERADKINCINNLKRIDSAKAQWALDNKKSATDTPTWADLTPYINNAPLVCPDNGTYSLNPVGEKPTCSVPGHKLSE